MCRISSISRAQCIRENGQESQNGIKDLISIILSEKNLTLENNHIDEEEEAEVEEEILIS